MTTGLIDGLGKWSRTAGNPMPNKPRLPKMFARALKAHRVARAKKPADHDSTVCAAEIIDGVEFFAAQRADEAESLIPRRAWRPERIRPRTVNTSDQFQDFASHGRSQDVKFRPGIVVFDFAERGN